MGKKVKENYTKIGGWLIFIIIGYVTSIYDNINLIKDSINFYLDGTINLLLDKSSDSFFPEAVKVINFEILLEIILVGMIIYAFILMFRKNKKFPNFAITLIILSNLFAIIDYFLCNRVGIIFSSQQWGMLVGSLVGGIIWIIYFKKSKRVKDVFTKETKTIMLNHLTKLIIVLSILSFFILYYVNSTNFYSNIFDVETISYSITYTLEDSILLEEAIKAKEEWVETKIDGKTTSWGLKTRYEVGKDLEPGTYTINSKGYASYNIFMGKVDISFKDNNNKYWINPLERAVCYSDEVVCSRTTYYNKVSGLTFELGDVIYTAYSPYSGQSVSIRFEPEEVEIFHPAIEGKEKVYSEPTKVIEEIKFVKGEYYYYINDIEQESCEKLKKCEDIMEQF